MTWRVIALNVVSGLALLCGAAWFSYNLFSARSPEPSTTTVEVFIR